MDGYHVQRPADTDGTDSLVADESDLPCVALDALHTGERPAAAAATGRATRLGCGIHGVWSNGQTGDTEKK